MNEEEKIVDPRLWQLYAGTTIHVPLLNSDVCYFPQGHAEQTHSNVDFDAIPRVSPCILCKVTEVKLLTDPEQEQVYAKIMLHPLEYDVNDERILVETHTESESRFNFPYFAKTTTVSNAKFLNVPLKHAERIFPPVADWSDQILKAKDIHGNIWEFKHSTSERRHRLTGEWTSYFVKEKVNVGDSVVFLQAETGELCVGVRRSVRARTGAIGKVRPDDVIQAVSLAKTGKPFWVTYYPHASTSEFIVNASSVKTALGTRWNKGTRFTMAFETDKLTHTSLFAGTVSSVQVVDPSLWPDSPWRMLQVDWDENQEQLKNVKCVSPWQVQVDLVSKNPNTRGARHSGFQVDYGNNDLTTGSSSSSTSNMKKTDEPAFLLFGQPVYTNQQVNHSSDENANEVDVVQKHDDDSSTDALPNMFENEEFDNSTSFT